MEAAAFASLRQPVTLALGPVAVVVDPQPIRVWLAAGAEPTPLFELLSYDDAMELSALRYDHEVDDLAFRDAWREVLAAQSGMEWWKAERLLTMLLHGWETFAGQMSTHGLDALSLPLDQALTASVSVVRQGMNEKDWRAFEQKLNVPPPAPRALGVRTPPPGWDDQKNADNWMAVAATRTPGLRRSAAPA